MNKIEETLTYGWRLESPIESVFPYGSGHIHDTYRVTLKNQKSFIFQKFNDAVFPRVDAVHQNLKRIITHLRKKYGEANCSPDNFLLPVATRNGNLYIQNDEGQYFRLFHFIPDTLTYDVPPNRLICKAAGEKFGQFLFALSDLAPDSLETPIEGFHSISYRFSQLDQAIEAADSQRVKAAKGEIETLLENRKPLHRLEELQKQGKLPLRVVHNDTKLNNILFDSHDNAIAVIDLDTTMPGLIHYDYGDAIRTIANSAKEDSKDIENVRFSMENFSAFSEGFLPQLVPILTTEEKETLYLAPKTVTSLMALRFLSDFLNGDIYYKVLSPRHNLIRCRVQLKLFRVLYENEAALRKKIAELMNR